MSSTFQPANALQAYLAPNLDLPKDTFENFYASVNQRERETGTIMNLKENATYSNREIITNQNWFTTDPQVQRQGWRLALPIDPALIAGVNNYPHGLGAIAGFTFTRIYAVAQDTPTTIATPIPQAEPAAANRATSIEVIGANVVITLAAGSPYVGFTGNIVLEYLKN